MCPNNIRTNNSLHQSYAVVTWVEPKYSDNSVGVDPLAEVIVTSNFKSGQKFLIGQHPVQYAVRDKEGLTAKCSFTVDVLGEPLKTCAVSLQNFIGIHIFNIMLWLQKSNIST